MRHGAKVRITLSDGSTLEGTLKFSWGWWSHKLVDVVAHTPHGAVDAAGVFIIPRHAVVMVQVVTD